MPSARLIFLSFSLAITDLSDCALSLAAVTRNQGPPATNATQKMAATFLFEAKPYSGLVRVMSMVWLLRHKTPRLGAVKPDAFLVRSSVQEWPLISRPS